MSSSLLLVSVDKDFSGNARLYPRAFLFRRALVICVCVFARVYGSTFFDDQIVEKMDKTTQYIIILGPVLA